jgi:hypothetical protein
MSSRISFGVQNRQTFTACAFSLLASVFKSQRCLAATSLLSQHAWHRALPSHSTLLKQLSATRSHATARCLTATCNDIVSNNHVRLPAKVCSGMWARLNEVLCPRTMRATFGSQIRMDRYYGRGAKAYRPLGETARAKRA